MRMQTCNKPCQGLRCLLFQSFLAFKEWRRLIVNGSKGYPLGCVWLGRIRTPTFSMVFSGVLRTRNDMFSSMRGLG